MVLIEGSTRPLCCNAEPGLAAQAALWASVQKKMPAAYTQTLPYSNPPNHVLLLQALFSCNILLHQRPVNLSVGPFRKQVVGCSRNLHIFPKEFHTVFLNFLRHTDRHRAHFQRTALGQRLVEHRNLISQALSLTGAASSLSFAFNPARTFSESSGSMPHHPARQTIVPILLRLRAA